MDEIAQECIRAIAQAKGLAPETISPETTFEQLALDSLDLVSLSFDLEEKYGIEIPDHRLHEIRSIADLVAEIHSSLNKKAVGGAPAQ